MSFIKVSELQETTELKDGYLLVTTKEGESRKFNTNNLEMSISDEIIDSLNDIRARIDVTESNIGELTQTTLDIVEATDGINTQLVYNNERFDIIESALIELDSDIDIIYDNINLLDDKVANVVSDINIIQEDIEELNTKSYSIKIFENGQELGSADSLDIIGGNLELVDGKLKISFSSSSSDTSIKTIDKTIIEDNKIVVDGIIGDVIYNTARVYDDLDSELFVEYTCITSFNDIIFDEADNLNGKYAIVSYLSRL